MRINVVNRLVVAAGIGAVALLGLSVSAYATPRQNQSPQEQQKQQKGQNKLDQARDKQHQQQLTVERQKPGTYSRDPYFSTPASYRYSRGGHSYETNEYGVNLLKQSVNYGYDQGYRTGEADRTDHSPSNFEVSFAYRDANYGYGGFYVDRDDYNFYFREGFRRGYEDGFGRHTAFGVYANGRGTILDAELGSIFHAEVIVR